MSDDLNYSLQRVETELAELAAEEQQVTEAIENIDLDLDNDLDAFMATTGRPRDDFYRWRKRARQAQLFKQRRLTRIQALKRDAEVKRSRLSMLILADRAGYRGNDPLKLLDALLMLTMSLIERTGVELDEQETGLLMVVHMQCGYRAPGERAS